MPANGRRDLVCRLKVKGGTGNAFPQLRDLPHTKQTHCLLHIEVEMMKLKHYSLSEN